MITQRPVIYCDTPGCGDTFTAGVHSTRITKTAVLRLAVDHAGWSAGRFKSDDGKTRHYCPTCTMFAASSDHLPSRVTP